MKTTPATVIASAIFGFGLLCHRVDAAVIISNFSLTDTSVTFDNRGMGRGRNGKVKVGEGM